MSPNLQRPILLNVFSNTKQDTKQLWCNANYGEKRKKERKGNPSQCNNVIVDNRCKFATEKTNKISTIFIFEIILFHKNEEMVEGTLLII